MHDFSAQEREHYQRHVNLPDVGEAGQQRLKQARVLYVGAGGLGCAALPYLAAAGVGTLGIVDDDCIEVSNLQRQILYAYASVGQKKTQVAAARLRSLNPHIQIVTHDTRLSRANVLALFQQYDWIADGSDNFATRYVVNDACFHLQKPYVYASIAQFSGQCSVLAAAPHGACLRCLFPTPPPPSAYIPNCAEGGVLGVLPGIIGTIQAMEIIKLILGIGKPLVNRLLHLDALTMQFRELELMQDATCRLCHDQQAFASLPDYTQTLCSTQTDISAAILHTWQQQGKDFMLVDIREEQEYRAGNLGGVWIPLRELSARLSELNKQQPIVVHCQHGVRSKHAVALLQQHGFAHVYHLQGGMVAWMSYYASC
ncbi:MAG: hypothetical protein A3E83_01120 [Gammaproteobacteria bacterium RIFCSPHIGHO2_12_FULL_41_20]|nr:MAG: hypothetical protein A3E83_01120 [Gammaproteobacteria bacterium RIFCSPHIGHO2_12_FULL_41_20]